MKNQIKESTLLPEHYTKANEPFFSGKGEHNVLELETICEEYKELVHQLRIRERNLLRQLNAEIVK